MMDWLETGLDLLSWILAGAFFGLTALGGLYYYESLKEPGTPRVTIKPIQTDQSSRTPDEKSFRPLEEFYLVQQYGRTEPDTDAQQSKPQGTETTPEPKTETSVASEQLPESELPYRLMGTITGSQNFRSAVVLSVSERTTRTLRTGETWGNLRVRTIEEDRIIIKNLQTDRLEKLSLTKNSRSNEPSERRVP